MKPVPVPGANGPPPFVPARLPGRAPFRPPRRGLGFVRKPVLVPGSMGTASYVLAGVPGGAAFASACHGAGRVLSRHAAARQVRGAQLRRDLEAAGIAVRGASVRGLAEEAPLSYKDTDEVVRTCQQAGLAVPVARLVPLGVVKG